MDRELYADLLAAAEKNVLPVSEPLTVMVPDMTLEDAYEIQSINVNKRLENGESLLGYKIGLTSTAMQKLFNIDKPDYGRLFENMLIPEGEPLMMSEVIQPKVEGELTFVLDKPLKGPGVTAMDVYAATRYVVPSIEVVDSRFSNWAIKLEDTVADNGSSSRFILGSAAKPVTSVDMQLTGMVMTINGELVGSGTTIECMGNPAYAVAVLANMLGEQGIELPAGSVIMSGAITAAMPVHAGDTVCVSFHGMGSVTLNCK